MADDKGLRSVEINLSNMTTGNFTIQSVSLLGNGSEWIKNETPTQGEQLPLYNALPFGAMNNDFNTEAGGTIVLTDVGTPITITFANDQHGNSTCTCTTSSTVAHTITQVNTGELQHSQFNVTLNAITVAMKKAMSETA